MSAPFRAAWATSLTLAAFLLIPDFVPAQEDAPPPIVVPKKEDGIHILARGPLHEAFAQPTEARPEPGLVVPRSPPAPVPEVPPDQKPKSENARWVPGYWAWDVEKKDFFWISGVWRVPPPGRKWVPGQWHQASDGWQWVSGFWAPAEQDNLRPLDEPPESLENGPSSPPPDQDSTYVPGNWVPRGGSYAWRPGFWNTNYSEWIWNPDGYYWTPSGYIYNPGYWDYNLEDRGLIFAPAYFDQPYWNTPGWTYTPSYCIGFPGLFGSLFYGPNNWFYFGNFYGPYWRGWGFQPWCFWGPRHGNALWNHYAWRNRFNPGWANAQRAQATARFNGRAPVPANTLAGQNAMARHGNTVNGHSLHMVTPLHQMGSQMPLTQLSPAQQNLHRTMATQHATAPRVYNGGPSAAPRAMPRGATGGTTYRSAYPGGYMPRTATGHYGHGMPAYRGLGGYYPSHPANHGAPAYHHAAPGGYHHAAPGGYHHGGGHMGGGHHGGHR